MKGVILAGGSGSRLYPLTKATNKHLLPVGREPMLYHAVRQLVSAQITDILVITSHQHIDDIARCLEDGAEFGCTLSYKIQRRPAGVAHALSLAEAFSAGTKTCVLLGDNIFATSIRPYAEAFRRQHAGARVIVKTVADASRYGVAMVRDQRIVAIEEKPQAPQSALAVLGLYFYDADLYAIIRGIEPSPRGELEITAVNNAYLQRGQLQYSVYTGGWSDAGTFESLFEAHQLLASIDNEIKAA